MKIRIMMKSPDALFLGIREALKDVEVPDNLDDYEKEEYLEEKSNECWEVASKWMRSGEYLMVEMDTEAETCVVLER